MEGGGEGSLPPGVEQSGGEGRSNLNISDVFEAISNADPSFLPAGAVSVEPDMFTPPPAQPALESRPYVRIVEQPASKALRFRYECEGRSAGSIPGAHSTPENKTYPTIEIVGHKGRAVVVVSCVTKDKPYKPHPHNLVGRDLCKNGVCTVHVHPDNMLVSFSNLGIQCVKKKDIEEALRVRESIRVDPFKTGFAHKSQTQGIDLNAVRLCFQVFLEQGGKIRHALPPAVSDVIYDKKAMNDLVITRLSHCSAPVMGGTQLILLCEKVAKEDIAVTFFEKVGEQVTWQADAADLVVHKQVAICFTTPRYHNVHATDHVQVNIQLRRPTDNERSEALPFELIPMTSADPHYLKRKRQKQLSDFSDYAQPEHELNQPIQEYYNEFMGIARDQKIKLEPRDKTPPHAMSTSPGMLPTMPLYREPSASPHLTHLDHYQPWPPQPEAASLAVPGPSHLGAPYSPHAQDMGWGSPAMGHMGHVSPGMGHVSPGMGHVSPGMGHVSPGMGHVSPNLVQQPTLTQLGDAGLMETEDPSLSRLLQHGDIPQLNSTELSGLSTFLEDKAPDQLSDSLHRLSTSDLHL